MNTESKPKNRQTRARIEAMAARAFGGMALAGGEDAVLELKEGWFNAAYGIKLAVGRQVILKIAPPQGTAVMLYEKDVMATEVASMHLVRRNPAIPVPESTFSMAPTICATRTTWKRSAETILTM